MPDGNRSFGEYSLNTAKLLIIIDIKKFILILSLFLIKLL